MAKAHYPFQLDAEITVKKNNQIFLNRKRIDLVRNIRYSGSILSASKTMKISYQQAWTFIKEMNELSPLPIVTRQRGGSNGGGAVVTSYGLELIEKYMKMEQMQNEYLVSLGEVLDSCFL
jgi:molybdate transport system regulatory protein